MVNTRCHHQQTEDYPGTWKSLILWDCFQNKSANKSEWTQWGRLMCVGTGSPGGGLWICAEPHEQHSAVSHPVLKTTFWIGIIVIFSRLYLEIVMFSKTLFYLNKFKLESRKNNRRNSHIFCSQRNFLSRLWHTLQFMTSWFTLHSCTYIIYCCRIIKN